jgi:molecular chaperone HtpG
VDSDDLPLNVSREMLQQNNIMKVIKRNLVKKCIEMMSELASSVEEADKKKWSSFYDNFNKNIKLGVHEDQKNRDKLIDLLMFNSTKSEEDKTTLKNYVARMKEGQSKIYYITGENLKIVRTSPFIEKLKKKGLEVLYLVDPIDEYMMQSVKEYDGKEFVCCSKDSFEIEQTEDEKKAFQELEKEWEGTCTKIKNILTPRVMNVKISDKLLDNPCVLVSDRYGWTANMERIMKAQALRNNSMMDYMGSRKILEINPEHKIIQQIKEKLGNPEGEKESVGIIEMLFDTVLLDSGYSIEEPNKYAQKIYRLISIGMAGYEDEDDGAGDGEAGDGKAGGADDLPPVLEEGGDAPKSQMEELD